MNGKIKRVEIFPVGKPAIKIQNGSFPQRYKPTFSNSSKRFERITEFWSAAIEKVQIFYSVPVQVAIVSVGKDWVLKEIHVEFFKPENRQVEVGLVMKNEPKVVDPLAVVDHISNGFNGDWKRVAHGDFSDLKNVNSDVVVDGMGDLELQGPDNFLFAAINSRVVVRGVFEKVAKVTN